MTLTGISMDGPKICSQLHSFYEYFKKGMRLKICLRYFITPKDKKFEFMPDITRKVMISFKFESFLGHTLFYLTHHRIGNIPDS